MRTPADPARRDFLRAAALPALAAAVGMPPATARAAATLRIGHLNGMLRLLREHGMLDPSLRAAGIAVQWVEATRHEEQVEAFRAGAIDFGDLTDTGYLQALAGGAALRAVGASVPRPRNVGLLVRADEGVRTVAHLRGHAITVAPATSAHALVLHLLAREGLAAADVQLLLLAPDAGHDAFASGEARAWAVADPFLAAAQRTLPARVLADGAGWVGHRILYASPARQAVPGVALVFESLRRLDAWAASHRGALARELAVQWGVPLPVVEASVARADYGTTTITPAILREQQEAADLLAAAGVLKRVDVFGAALPAPYGR